MFLFHQRLTEKLFGVLALFFFTGVIAPFITETNPIHPIAFYFLPNFTLVVSILLMAARWQKVMSIVVREQLLWAVIAITVTSVLWSEVPEKTLDFVLPLIRVSVFAVYFSTRYTLSEQWRILLWVFGVAALFSFIFGLLLPSYGVMGMGFIANMEDIVHTGKWRGIFIHKTELGSMMSLSALLFFCSNIERPYRWIKWAGFYVSIFLILRSTTAGALLILLIILALIPLYRALRWNYSLALPFFIFIFLAAGGAVTVLTSNFEALVSGIGKDITISGRTEFWPGVMDKILLRPLLGYGYRTFWLGGWEGEPADIWRSLKAGFEPPHAHNGPLEILLDSGFIGFALFSLCFIVVGLRAIAWIRATHTTEGLLPLAYLTYTMLLNLTESYLMKPDIYWAMYIALTLSMFSRTSNVTDEDDEYWQQQLNEEEIA